MVKSLNNTLILNKLDEIINEIETSEEYKKYLVLKDEIKKNKELVLLINKVRQLNKDFNHKLVKKDELDRLTNELNNHPLYREYLNTISVINNELSIVENAINNYFKKKLEN
jgi:cell fate (sporulation/competence/biofilm development) regulator YmcA (YheA/YmcA/DUF963 family)